MVAIREKRIKLEERIDKKLTQTRVYNTPKKKNYGEMRLGSGKNTPLKGSEE